MPELPTKDEEEKKLLGEMAGNKSHNFLPMLNLMPALKVLASMEVALHSDFCEPQAYLLSGPQGTGKTHLVQAFAKQMAARIATAEGGRLTLCCTTNLADHRPHMTVSFHEWLFSDAARQLDRLGLHAPVVEALMLLGSLARDRLDDTDDEKILRPKLPSGSNAISAAFEALPQEVSDVLWEAVAGGRLAMASAVLRHANIAVIVHVDEAECLFRKQRFTFACAERWCSQMRDLLRLGRSAVGLILCASYQRARQLFISGGQPHRFPSQYTHLDLRGDWTRSELRHIRLGGPAWDSTSLLAFLLTHACRKVDTSFGLYQRSPDEYPSATTLEVARKLDALFLWGWEGGEGLSPGRKQTAFLEHIMERYGHTPRDLATAAVQCLAKWTPSNPWLSLPLEAARPSMGEGDPRFHLVAGTFLEILPDDKRRELAGQTMLSFHSAQCTVPKGLLKQALEKQFSRQPPPAAVASGSSTVDQAATLAAQCIDDAVDAGWLVDGAGWWGLGSLTVYRQFMCGDVHSDIVMWMRHEGYGQEAELPIGRALARMPQYAGDVLVRGHGGSVRRGNDDSQAGELANLKIVLPPDASEDSLPTVAVPRECAGSAPGTAAAAGAGEAAGTESRWDARAQAAHDSLQGMHAPLREYLSLCKGAFWVKEAPDVRGGDLIGVFPGVKEGDPTATVVRVQVKYATQKTLKDREQYKVGDDRVREAVKSFMGVRAYSQAQRVHLERRHKPVVGAVCDLIIAAQVDAARGLSSGSASMQDWSGAFKAAYSMPGVRFVDGGAIIAMTHQPSQKVKSAVKRLGIHIIDGVALRGYWGQLQVVCDILGVLLAPSWGGKQATHDHDKPATRPRACGRPCRRFRVRQQAKRLTSQVGGRDVSCTWSRALVPCLGKQHDGPAACRPPLFQTCKSAQLPEQPEYLDQQGVCHWLHSAGSALWCTGCWLRPGKPVPGGKHPSAANCSVIE
jgi:hypothetical protein